MKIFDINMLF